MKPLYNHTSEETAYLVNDYPYSFKLRCRIRYWLEKSNTKGFRFVSQTENPKTLRWNAPKKSTYAKFASNLYLNEDNHVKCAEVSEYTSSKTAQQFIELFPETDSSLLKPWAELKVKYHGVVARGEGFLRTTINGVVQPISDDEKENRMNEARVDLEHWENVLKAVTK